MDWTGLLNVLLGVGVTALVAAAVAVLNTRQAHRREDRADTHAELREVVEQLQKQLTADGDRHRAEGAALTARIDRSEAGRADCEQRAAQQAEQIARLRTRLEAIEDWMAATGQKGPFRPFDPDGSWTHRPLPPGGQT